MPAISELEWHSNILILRGSSLKIKGDEPIAIALLEYKNRDTLSKIALKLEVSKHKISKFQLLEKPSDWLLRIDLSEVLAQCEPEDIMSVKFSLLRTSNYIGRNRNKGVFDSFTSGFALSETAVAIPDEDEDGSLVLRCVGNAADASGEPYARIKKRSFTNRILLFALTSAPGTAHAFAEALRTESLQTTIAVTNGGGYCHASTNSGISLSVDLRDMPGIYKPTILDNGKCLDEISSLYLFRQRREYLLKMLKEIDTLCKEHHIEYFLACGSLLGAVRHGGLIPWDDDIDLFMTAENYKKFQEVYLSGGFQDNRLLDDGYSVPGYPGSFGRYVDCSTTYFFEGMSRGAGGIGSIGKVIDIFILIPLSGSAKERHEKVTKFLVYDELANRFHRSKGTRDDLFVDMYNQAIEACKKYGRDYVVQQLAQEVFSLDENPTHYYSSASSYRTGVVFKKEWFDSSRMVPYEGALVPIPKGYLDVLREDYGPDFRQYPENTHPSETGNYISDVIPCGLVAEDIANLVPSAEALNAKAAYKDLEMEEMIRRRVVSPSVYRLEAQRVIIKLQNNPTISNVDELLHNRNYELLFALFDEYYEMQLNSKYLYWPVLIPLEDSLLNAALLSMLCWKGDCEKAAIILDIYQQESGEPSCDLRKTAELVASVCRLRDAIEYGDFASAYDLCTSVLKNNHDVIEARLAEQYLSLRNACVDSNDLNDIEAILREIYDRSHHKGALFLLAIIAHIRGEFDNSFSLLSYVENMSNDGMLIRAAKHMKEKLND